MNIIGKSGFQEPEVEPPKGKKEPLRVEEEKVEPARVEEEVKPQRVEAQLERPRVGALEDHQLLTYLKFKLLVLLPGRSWRRASPGWRFLGKPQKIFCPTNHPEAYQQRSFGDVEKYRFNLRIRRIQISEKWWNTSVLHLLICAFINKFEKSNNHKRERCSEDLVKIEKSYAAATRLMY